MAGFDDVIHFLAKNDVKWAINSNKSQYYLNKEINFFDIANKVDIIVGSGNQDNDKPSPDGVFSICEYWGLIPNSSICYVGDSDINTKTAINAGITPILIINLSDEIFDLSNNQYANLNLF